MDVSKAFEPDSVVRIGFEGQQTEIRILSYIYQSARIALFKVSANTINYG